MTPVAAASQSALQTASLPQTEPIFRSLFQAGERSQPVSPAVQELWGNSSSLTSVASATSVARAIARRRTPEIRAPRPLDLFSDRAGTFSS